VPVRQGALDGEDLLGAGHRDAAAQQYLQAFDRLIGQARQTTRANAGLRPDQAVEVRLGLAPTISQAWRRSDGW